MVIVSTKPYTYLLEPLWLLNLLFHNILGAPYISNSIAPNWSYNTQDYTNNRVYSFGYEIEDFEADNIQFRTEKRFPNGTVVGSYGYVELNGNIHMVHYVADENGYRAHVEDSFKNLDNNKAAHSFSQEMGEAIKSLNLYKKQIQDQRLRPFDEQSEEKKIEYILSKNGYNDVQLNQKVRSKSNDYFDDNYDFGFIL